VSQDFSRDRPGPAVTWLRASMGRGAWGAAAASGAWLARGGRLHDRGDLPLGGGLTAEKRGKHSTTRQHSTVNLGKPDRIP
jgi:hypothetical protein